MRPITRTAQHRAWIDILAQSMASGTSRRTILRMLTLGLTARLISAPWASPVRAQDVNLVAEGGDCSAPDAVCFQPRYFGAVLCADNGIAEDGPLNCCREGGGPCSDHGQCCAGWDCIDGLCGGELTAASQLPPGSSCTAAEQCDASHGPIDCAENGSSDDGERNCCGHEGAVCFNPDNSDCCGNLTCVGTPTGNQCQSVDATEPSADAELYAACDAYLASLFANLGDDVVWVLLDSWSSDTADYLQLPEQCPWPVLPPESPWCTSDGFCRDSTPLEHSDDGTQFCYFRDPAYASSAYYGDFGWSCVSILPLLWD